ncbi:thymidylate synthase [Vibrio phage 12VC501]|nr:thymidylate synthase [Vibrio phage 12VC501]
MIDYQYIQLCKRILAEGKWVTNQRTGKRCLTIRNATFHYTPLLYGNGWYGNFPLDTTRKSFWKAAIAELLGYLKGYTNAHEFQALGAPTWINNAYNPVWLENPNCKGGGDMGHCYGSVGHNFGGVNQFKKVYDDLSAGIDDRGEIITFWKPDDFDKACLRPCMFQHHFTLIDDQLSLTSYQRSCDVPLGLNFNMIQVYVFLVLMAQITGNQPLGATHHIVNAHMYEDQVELMEEQVKRQPLDMPKLWVNPNIITWDDLMNATLDDFKVEDYKHHPAIKYPFTT